MRPVIGVLPLVDDEKESFWMLPGYFGGLKSAGAVPVMLSPSDNNDDINEYFKICRGFLFTGGQDTDPSIYGEKKLNDSVIPSKIRDDTEKKILEKALENDVPVFGICRGIQFINAFLGGTLYQDLDSQYKSGVNHHMNKPYDSYCHKVTIDKKSTLFSLIGKDEIKVNSIHHQAVKNLAPGLEITAVSEDGLIEAVNMPSKKFVRAVQWHPEYLYKKDENSRRIFGEFVSSCR